MKQLCIEIAPITSVVHTETNNGKINILSCFRIDISDYVNNGEIINLLQAINSICSVVKSQSIKTRNVVLTCSSVQSETIEISDEPKSLKKLFSKNQTIEENNIIYTRKLGSCFYDGFNRTFAIKSSVDKELSISFFRAFNKNGFHLNKIVSKLDAILSFSELTEASYDTVCKIIIDLTDKSSAHQYFLYNDILTNTKSLDDVINPPIKSSDTVAQLLLTSLTDDMYTYKIKNPKIIIVSNDVDEYVNINQYLKSQNLDVYNHLDDIDFEEYNVSFSIPLSLALHSFYKKNTDLVIKQKPPMSEKKLKTIGSLCVFCAVCTLILPITNLTSSIISYYDQANYKNQISQLQIEQQTLISNKEILNTTLDMYNQISDKTFKLVDFQLDFEDIYIASIDTLDMLPKISIEDNISQTAIQTTISEINDTIEISEEAINDVLVIRGYSNNMSSISELVSSLSNEAYSYVNLKGIEEMNTELFHQIVEVYQNDYETGELSDIPTNMYMPIDEKIFAFEIEVK